MKLFFVRFYIEFPETAEDEGYSSENSQVVEYEHSIEYKSDIEALKKIIGDQRFHQRFSGNPRLVSFNPPLPIPKVWLLDWRELLGEERPAAER